jgi:hypothetical protein
MSWRQRPGFKRSDLFQDFSEVLAAGYENFQLVAIALETVLNGVNATRVDYIRKMGNFWKVSYQAAIRVVEATYLTLKSDPMLEDLTLLPRVGRKDIPRRYRCVTDESRRDMRDWFILRDTLWGIDEFLRHIFIAYNTRNRSH